MVMNTTATERNGGRGAARAALVGVIGTSPLTKKAQAGTADNEPDSSTVGVLEPLVNLL